MVAIALKTIGESTRFFLTRSWVRTRIGLYLVTTTEVRPSAYETTVTLGEGGPEIKHFGSALAFERRRANENHEELCERVEAVTGVSRVPAPSLPPA